MHNDYKVISLIKSDIIEHRKNNLILFDIGANINELHGAFPLLDFTKLFLDTFGESIIEKIYAFEPLMYQRFEEIYKNNSKVVLIKQAVDNITGEQIIYSPGSSHDLTSFYNRKAFSRVPIKHTISCITIDDFVKENKINYIDYLKIDAEGAELRILKGAQNILEKKLITAGQFEVSIEGTYRDAGITLEDIKKYLSKFGYIVEQVAEDCCIFKNN